MIEPSKETQKIAMKQFNKFMVNRFMKTNATIDTHLRLDEILQQFSLDVIQDLSLTEMNLGNKVKLISEAKQAIADLFEEKCLEEVRDAFRTAYFASGIIPNEQNIDAFDIAYIHYFNKFINKRQKLKQVKEIL